MTAGRRLLAVATMDETKPELDIVHPETVFDLYLAERETDLAERTRRS